MTSEFNKSAAMDDGYDEEALRLKRHDEVLTNSVNWIQMIIRILDFGTAYYDFQGIR